MKHSITIIFLLSAEIVLASTADTITLNLSQYQDAYPQTADGYWTEVYNDNAHIEAGLFRFSHNGSPDEGMGMPYWDGFIYCTSGDNTNYGSAGSSDGWVGQQWGCMAGGGLDSLNRVKLGNPYLVAYWGYYEEGLDDTYHSLRIDFTDNKQHRPVGVYICNHPWPYYGNEQGDGFASAFTQDGDYFGLVVHGLNSAGEDVGITIRHELASFRNGELVQSPDWQYIDLTALGMVSGIYFTMETTDEDALFGANTAVFFCLDRLSVETESAEAQTLSRPEGVHLTDETETTLTLHWDKVSGAEEYVLYVDSQEIATITDTLFTFNGLEAAVTYQLAVQAIATTADSSDWAVMSATPPDLTAPVISEPLTATADDNSIHLQWLPATDNVAVMRYTVYLDNEPYKRTTQTEYTLTGLLPDTEYVLSVEAEDAAGNKSEKITTTVKTLGRTALDEVQGVRGNYEVYTIQGEYVGTTIPLERSIYIIKQGNNSQLLYIIN